MPAADVAADVGADAAADSAAASSFQPPGKDYVVDLSNKKFPCVRRAGRSFTSVNGNVFNLPEQFEITKSLGAGSYCTVVAATDNDSGEEVAIKKCSYVFARQLDGKRLLREVKLSRGLHHKNILPLTDILIPVEDDFSDLYFVTEKMDTDLYHFQNKRALPETEAKPILYQVLKALSFIHSAHVIHRDMKPDNILLRLKDGAVKICDFNLSRGESESDLPMTTNIATRWYRSPEVLLGLPNYDGACDVWSLGCIFAEMLTGETLFNASTDIDMLSVWASKLGLTTEEDLTWLPAGTWKESMRGVLEKADGERHLADGFPKGISAEALDFLGLMLRFSPKDRALSSDLLQHDYMKEYFVPEAVKPCSRVFKWKYDDENPSVETMRGLFWKEINNYHPEGPTVDGPEQARQAA